MPVLKPRRHRKPLRTHTVLPCVVARYQVGWCRGICAPVNGFGLCGRVAPHGLKGRTQEAIARYCERQARRKP